MKIKKTIKQIISLAAAVIFVLSTMPAVFAEYSNPDNDPVLFSENFSAWTPSSTTFNQNELSVLSNGSMSGSSALAYSITGDGGLMAYVPYPVSSSYASTYLSMDKAIRYEDYSNELVFTLDIKKEALQVKNTDGTFSDAAVSYNGFRQISLYYTDSDNSIQTVPVIQLTDTGNLQRATGTTYYGTPEQPAAATDSDGYFSLRFVLSKEDYTVTTTSGSITYNWVIRVYDTNSSNRIIYSHRYHTSNSSGYTALPAVEGFCLSSYQPEASRSAGEARITIRNPKIALNGFYALLPEVKEIDALAGIMNISFTKDIAGSTVSSDTVTLTDSAGNNVITGYGINGNVMTLEYKPLNAGQAYSLNILPGLMSTAGDNAYTDSYPYTAFALETLFEQDFTDTAELTYSISELNYINPQLGAVYGTNQTFTAEYGSLMMNNAVDYAASESESLSLYLKKPVTAGMITAHIKLRAENAYSSAGNFSRLITAGDSTDANGEIAIINDDGVSLSCPSASYTSTGSAPFITEDINGRQYIDIILVLSRTSASSKWNIAIFDGNSGSDTAKLISSINANMVDISSIDLSVWRDNTARQSAGGVPNTNAPIGLKSAEICRSNQSTASLGGSLSSDAASSFGFIGNTVKWNGSVYSYGINNTPAKIYIAAYDMNNALLGTNIFELSGFDDLKLSLEIDSETGSVDHAKLMVMDINMNPLIDALEQSEPWTVPVEYASHLGFYAEYKIGNDIASTTVTAQNIKAFNPETNTLIPIKEVQYFPYTGLMRIRFDTNTVTMADKVTLSSAGLTKTDGKPYSLSDMTPVKAIMANETESAFISDITVDTDALNYSVRIINSSSDTSAKQLMVFGVNNGKTEVLSVQNLILNPFSEQTVTESFADESVLGSFKHKLYAILW